MDNDWITAIERVCVLTSNNEALSCLHTATLSARPGKWHRDEEKGAYVAGKRMPVSVYEASIYALEIIGARRSYTGGGCAYVIVHVYNGLFSPFKQLGDVRVGWGKVDRKTHFT